MMPNRKHDLTQQATPRTERPFYVHVLSHALHLAFFGKCQLHPKCPCSVILPKQFNVLETFRGWAANNRETRTAAVQRHVKQLRHTAHATPKSVTQGD